MLGEFKIEEIVRGFYFEGQYDIPYGEVLHDYLAE